MASHPGHTWGVCVCGCGRRWEGRVFGKKKHQDEREGALRR